MLYRYILIIALSMASLYAEKAPLLKFMKTIDWSYMGDKTEFTLDLCKCSDDDEGVAKAGLRARLAEPIAMTEYTNTPWNIVAINKKFDEGMNRKQGSSRGSQKNRRYAHVLSFPVMAALNFVQDAVCFERVSVLSFAYFSEIIPTQTNDLMALFAQGSKGPFSKIWYNNPIAGLMCSVDCGASLFNKSINSLHWCAGCAGATANNTAYGSSRSNDPIMGAHAHALTVLDDLHFSAIYAKVSNATFTYSPVKKIPNSVCKPTYFAVAPKTQYALNLASPTVWDATIIGKAAFTWTSFKNKLTSADDIAFWVWTIKDTCVGASKCKSMLTQKTN